MKQPQPFATSPIPDIKGSLQPFATSLGRNFDLVQASIRQIIQYLLDVEKRLPPDMQARVYALERQAAQMLSREQDFVKLTAGAGGTTWTLSALTGYPYLRAVIIDPNGEANTLNLPTLTATDRLCITVKCLANSGNVTISAGAANIVTLAGLGFTSIAIPYAHVPDGTTISTYAVTLLWTGTEWNVIDTAILTA